MFSVTSEYALRALVQLAREPAGVSVLGQDLAERAHIPANYLSKILWTLRNAGYLETTRGHGGGYRLAKPADQVTLIEIVRQFEGVGAEPGCLLGEQHECSEKTPCSAHAAWKKVKTAYVEFIRSTTLADIGKPDKTLARIATPRKKPVKPTRRSR
ncbi:MAG: RrF2 family transcriptional regulator [Pirellulaceae bacterium]